MKTGEIHVNPMLCEYDPRAGDWRRRPLVHDVMTPEEVRALQRQFEAERAKDAAERADRRRKRWAAFWAVAAALFLGAMVWARFAIL